MIDLETLFAVIFLLGLTIALYLKRDRLDTKQIIPYFLYFSMYRAKWGLRLMDSAANRFRKFMIYLGYFGIAIGFLGMIFIAYSLFSNIFMLFSKPETSPGVGLVLPFKAKGVFYVPFFYWIISIFVIAIVHEFSHGLIARAHNIKVKSSGFAFIGTGFRLSGLGISLASLYIKNLNGSLLNFNFLDFNSPDFWLVIGIVLIILSFVKSVAKIGYIPIIPAAFVEPDEKALRKRPHKEQLSVFAAGPLANIITAFLCLGIMLFVIAPIANKMVEPAGVKISNLVKENGPFPAETAGIKAGEVILQADSKPTPYRENLSAIMKSKKPNDVIFIKTDKSSYQLKLAKNPENESLAYMGAYLEQNTKINENIKSKYGEFLPNSLIWIYGLFIFLYILNLGIGLFNLVPIGPLDGGRMLQLPLQKYFGEENGNKVLMYVSLLFLIIILVGVGAGFGLLKLFG